MRILLIPTFLSLLTLAAHFFRNEQIGLALICLAAPMLLLARRAWATWTLQTMLIVGALEWVRTTFQIQAVRVEEGRDWHRMAAILLGVAGFTFLSGLLYSLPLLRRHYCIR